MHCKDTILRTQNNWPYSKLIPNSGKECDLSFKPALKVRMAYLKEVCRWILLKDSSYLSQLKDLFDLQENNDEFPGKSGGCTGRLLFL